MSEGGGWDGMASDGLRWHDMNEMYGDAPVFVVEFRNAACTRPTPTYISHAARWDTEKKQERTKWEDSKQTWMSEQQVIWATQRDTLLADAMSERARDATTHDENMDAMRQRCEELQHTCDETRRELDVTTARATALEERVMVMTTARDDWEAKHTTQQQTHADVMKQHTTQHEDAIKQQHDVMQARMDAMQQAHDKENATWIEEKRVREEEAVKAQAEKTKQAEAAAAVAAEQTAAKQRAKADAVHEPTITTSHHVKVFSDVSDLSALHMTEQDVDAIIHPTSTPMSGMPSPGSSSPRDRYTITKSWSKTMPSPGGVPRSTSASSLAATSTSTSTSTLSSPPPVASSVTRMQLSSPTPIQTVTPTRPTSLIASLPRSMPPTRIIPPLDRATSLFSRHLQHALHMGAEGDTDAESDADEHDVVVYADHKAYAARGRKPGDGFTLHTCTVCCKRMCCQRMQMSLCRHHIAACDMRMHHMSCVCSAIVGTHRDT